MNLAQFGITCQFFLLRQVLTAHQLHYASCIHATIRVSNYCQVFLKHGNSIAQRRKYKDASTSVCSAGLQFV